MTDREWYRELPPNERSQDEAVEEIIDEMLRPSDPKHALSLRDREKELLWLIREARHTYRMEWSDYLRRNSTGDTKWQPDPRLSKNISEGEAASYDYGEMTGKGLHDEGYGTWREKGGRLQWVHLGEGWKGWWKLIWGRGKGLPKRFRILKGLGDDETVTGNTRASYVDSGIPTAPLRAVYFLVNRWWREVLRQPFHPDLVAAPVEEFENDNDLLPLLNAAGRFFLLIAHDVDPTRRPLAWLCKKIDVEHYYGELPKALLHEAKSGRTTQSDHGSSNKPE